MASRTTVLIGVAAFKGVAPFGSELRSVVAHLPVRWVQPHTRTIRRTVIDRLMLTTLAPSGLDRSATSQRNDDRREPEQRGPPLRLNYPAQ